MEPLLITLSDFKEYFPDLPEGLTFERLQPHVLQVQRLRLRKVLGENLYKELLEAIGAATEEAPLAAHWTTLISYSKPLLVFASWAKYIPFSQTTPTAYSYVRKTEQWSEPIDGQTLGLIHNSLKNDANAYELELIAYLKDNKDLYPAYQNLNCGERRSTGGSGSKVIRI